MSTLTKRERAREILLELFANRQRIPIAEARAAGAAEDISARTMLRASKELGAVEIHNGPFGAFWERT